VSTPKAENPVSAPQVNALLAKFDDPKAPGCAVLVVKDGRAVFRRGYGAAELRTHAAISPETNFRLASVSKQFTAMAIMLLVHDGKLRYDDTLTKVFADFPEYGHNITIRELLNHTSGLVAYEDVMEAQNPGVPDEKIPQIHDAGVLELMKQQTATKFPPGTRWEYSNSGFVLLGLVVEKASGMSFGDFLATRIFKPLAMEHTIAYEKGKNEAANRAYGHSFMDGTWRETDQSSTSATLGDGGIYSSLEDLEKWDRALTKHTLLSEKEMDAAYTAPSVKEARLEQPNGTVAPLYGFGWFLDPYRGHKRYAHYGETMGFRSAIQRFPDDHLTVVVLMNRTDIDAPTVAESVADLYLKK
jgi:CubicO group peptidase (beta-lactamase class C family)